MKQFIPTNYNDPKVAQVVDLAEEEKVSKEAEALVELHDFIRDHPDSAAKEIARFMPPVDSRAVNRAIQILALRDKKNK